MAKLRVYADRVSQPSRAVLIFCSANGIEVEERLVNLMKGEHRKEEYLAINPMGLVPAVDDNGFYLFESHAILRYLACAYPSVKDHWYPADLRKRAQIECILDWHHTNLRRGAGGLVFNSVIAPTLGRALDPHAASECKVLLKASLEKIEAVWLKGDGRFLTGSLAPSIADLSLACEVMQLQVLNSHSLLGYEPSRGLKTGAHAAFLRVHACVKLLGREKVSELLDSFPKVKKWLDAVEKTVFPHFTQVHEILQKAAIALDNRREGKPKKEEAEQVPRPAQSKL